ncbi:MAG: BACON domain-containing carbohydrate-binding protein, partial [Bacteroidota bacterium]
LDMTGYSAVNLAFSHYFRSYTGSSATLSYSINNGSTWTTIQTYTATSANPASFSQSIPGAAGQAAVKFKWNYTGSYGYYWAIDNINITGTGAVTLTVTPANQNVTSPAGTTPFAVTTTAAWTATSNAAWCTVTPSGTGNGTLTATFTQNVGAASRVANITVAATGATSVVVTVTQAGTSPTLAVTPPNQNVTAPAGNTTFTVTSNSAWGATSDAAWCTVTASGTGNGTITATYTQNVLLTSRIANVTVTVTGLTPVVVTVTQAAGSATLAVTPANQNVSAAAGNINYTVTSTSAWTTSSNAAWCTLTPSGSGNGTLVATYTANILPTSRIANITVTVTGLTPVTVTLTQSGASPTLSVTPANQNVPAPAGNTSFSVTSNSAWIATSNAAWCTITPSGTGNGTIAAAYLENITLTGRTANVTVTVAGLTPVVVTVTQAAAAPILIVNPINIDVPAAAGTANYTVTSNAPWTATSGTFWCIVTPSGSGNGTLAAVYEANTSTSPRITYMAVSATGANNANITLTQAAAEPFLTADPHVQNVGMAAGTVNFTISSNLSWTVSSDVPWCTVTASGNGNGTVVATYSDNAFASSRAANITITANGITPISATVNVIQAGPSAALNVAPAIRTVTDPAGSTTFAVTANTSWTCSSDVNWCTTTTAGSGNGTITATFQQNLTPVIRTATLQVNGAGTLPASVKVLQLPSFVSVEENPENLLKVYPNPTTGLFVISSASTEMIEMKVTILDSKGQVVLSKLCNGANNYSFDLSQSARGAYFMKIETGGKVHLLKVIVE